MLIADLYSRALRSANLLLEERSSHSAADLVAAAGFSRAGPFAHTALRFLSGDESSAAPLLRLCRNKTVGRAWHHFHERLDPKAADEIAEGVLGFLANPRCPRCDGRRFVKLDGAPLLGPLPCAACDGTGDRPRPSDSLSRWLQAEIEREADIQSVEIAKRLRVNPNG